MAIALMASSVTHAAPILNSYPVATSTIYLDFDGQDVSSSMWNYGTPFSAAPSIMTDAQITEAFNRVSEDFRPFSVNVTTELSKFLAAPLDKRIRVIITPTSAWYPGVAGIAYVTSFTWGDDTPCFVFSDRLLNDGKRVAEAISHETGHTLGLYHQSSYTNTCTLTSSYHTGIGTGITSWGPIMGNVASKNLTQWNFGPTPNGCSFLQDNLSIITTTNGFSYRPDDVGDIYSAASVVTISSNTFTRQGVISTSGDKDIFRFDLGQLGKFNFNIEPYSAGANFSGANLDVKIELQNANGTSIKIYDITDSLNARIDTTLSAGIYYVIVDGTGNVNNANDYGSLGAYNITGYYSGTTVPPNPIPNPKDNTGDNVGDGDNDDNAADNHGNAEDEDDDKKRKKNNNKNYQKKYDRIGSASQLMAPGRETNQTEPIFKVIKQLQQPVMVVAQQAYEYQVVDNYGRIIMSGKSGPGSNTVDIRNHPSGVYFLKLLNSKERKTEKFFNG
jgi:hypothetical protein